MTSSACSPTTSTSASVTKKSGRKPMFRRELVIPGVSRRDDFSVDPQRCALLVIDIQRYLCPSLSSLHKNSNNENTSSSSPPSSSTPNPAAAAAAHEYSSYYLERFPSVVSNISQLAHAFRSIRDGAPPPPPTTTTTTPYSSTSTGCEVIFSYLQACTIDGRDISLDYKLSGPLLAGIPTTCEKDLFWPECAPNTSTGKGDILVPKTSCSAFGSLTNLDYLLRNLCIDQLVVVGQMTDQCVESAVRDAADLGYQVVVVDDACLSSSEEAQEKGLMGMKGFCRILTTQQMLHELNVATTSNNKHDSSSSDNSAAAAATAAAMIRQGTCNDVIHSGRNQVAQALVVSSSSASLPQQQPHSLSPSPPPPPVSSPPHFHQE